MSKKIVYALPQFILGIMIFFSLMIVIQLFLFPFTLSHYVYCILVLLLLCLVITMRKLKFYYVGFSIGVFGFVMLCLAIYSLHTLRPFIDAPSTIIGFDSSFYLFSEIRFASSLLSDGVRSNNLIGPFMLIAETLELGFIIFVPIYQIVHHVKVSPRTLKSNN